MTVPRFTCLSYLAQSIFHLGVATLERRRSGPVSVTSEDEGVLRGLQIGGISEYPRVFDWHCGLQSNQQKTIRHSISLIHTKQFYTKMFYPGGKSVATTCQAPTRFHPTAPAIQKTGLHGSRFARAPKASWRSAPLVPPDAGRLPVVPK